MKECIQDFGQEECCRILDQNNAIGLSQIKCTKILMNDGASFGQANTGAYVCLHHGDHLVVKKKGSQDEYDRELDDFGARQKRFIECVRHLEGLGFSYSQACGGASRYREKRDLVRERTNWGA